MKVSIITVCFNAAETIQATIDSIAAQTHEDIEYIVVDGGSSDQTVDIIRQNAEVITRWVSEPDEGIYNAMNKGIAMATGNAVAIVNADDKYLPEFVSQTVAKMEETGADITYTDQMVEGRYARAEPLDEGFFIHHYGLNHEAFLVKRQVYEALGGYDECFRIVSDAIWMRKAYREGYSFAHVPEALLKFGEQGLSSGQSQKARDLFISEMGAAYRDQFPFLSQRQAEALYLSRFNRQRVIDLLPIVEENALNEEFLASMRGYLRTMLRSKDSFCFAPHDAGTTFAIMLRLADLLEIDLSELSIQTERGDLRSLVVDIDNLASRRQGDKVCVLHYTYVFSRPTEPFIYKTIERLEQSGTIQNFVHCEHRLLPEERPFSNLCHLLWENFHPAVRNALFKRLIDRLQPDYIYAHFGQNGQRVNDLLEAIEVRIPMIVQFHGIDSFNIDPDSPYGRFFYGHLLHRDDIKVAVVSRYLGKELALKGVPHEKIELIPNGVDVKGAQIRKSSGYYRKGERPLRILNIGRLVRWKGHRYLLEAAAILKAQYNLEFEITIVYGKVDDCLGELRAQIVELGLNDNVRFVEFVNLTEKKDFFLSFDVFVSASTYSEETEPRSETFGLALLEAVAAGLPVVATDAGGAAEVVGEETRGFAKVVPHGNSSALASAVMEMVNGGTAFSDNRVYAEARLAHYSDTIQVERINKTLAALPRRTTKVAIVTTNTHGGAGGAAKRVHNGLVETGYLSRLFTAGGSYEDTHIAKATIVSGSYGPGAAHFQNSSNHRPGQTFVTVNEPYVSNSKLYAQLQDYDVINLHWTARFLSIENVAFLSQIGKPVVLTLRDMFYLAGGCHYFHGCKKWCSDCNNCPQFVNDRSQLAARFYEQKKTTWNIQNITVVVLSETSRQIVDQSPLFKGVRVETIPNGVDTRRFNPRASRLSAFDFESKDHGPVLLYAPSFASAVKGRDDVIAAVNNAVNRYVGAPPIFVAAGDHKIAEKDLECRFLDVGFLTDKNVLASLYARANVTLVPSHEETFSNTTAESLASGTPVVGYRAGALPDLVIDGVTGFLARVGDVQGLSDALLRAMSAGLRRADCVQHVADNFSVDLQTQRYARLFDELARKASMNRRSPGVDATDSKLAWLVTAVDSIGSSRVADQDMHDANVPRSVLRIRPGHTLRRFDRLVSENGRFSTEVGLDGEFSVLAANGQRVWSKALPTNEHVALKIDPSRGLVAEPARGQPAIIVPFDFRQAPGELTLSNRGILEIRYGKTGELYWNSDGFKLIDVTTRAELAQLKFPSIDGLSPGHGFEKPKVNGEYQPGFWAKRSTVFYARSSIKQARVLIRALCKLLDQSLTVSVNREERVEIHLRNGAPVRYSAVIGQVDDGDRIELKFSRADILSRRDRRIASAYVSEITLTDARTSALGALDKGEQPERPWTVSGLTDADHRGAANGASQPEVEFELMESKSDDEWRLVSIMVYNAYSAGLRVDRFAVKLLGSHSCYGIEFRSSDSEPSPFGQWPGADEDEHGPKCQLFTQAREDGVLFLTGLDSVKGQDREVLATVVKLLEAAVAEGAPLGSVDDDWRKCLDKIRAGLEERRPSRARDSLRGRLSRLLSGSQL